MPAREEADDVFERRVADVGHLRHAKRDRLERTVFVDDHVVVDRVRRVERWMHARCVGNPPQVRVPIPYAEEAEAVEGIVVAVPLD